MRFEYWVGYFPLLSKHHLACNIFGRILWAVPWRWWSVRSIFLDKALLFRGLFTLLGCVSSWWLLLIFFPSRVPIVVHVYLRVIQIDKIIICNLVFIIEIFHHNSFHLIVIHFSFKVECFLSWLVLKSGLNDQLFCSSFQFLHWHVTWFFLSTGRPLLLNYLHYEILWLLFDYSKWLLLLFSLWELPLLWYHWAFSDSAIIQLHYDLLGSVGTCTGLPSLIHRLLRCLAIAHTTADDLSSSILKLPPVEVIRLLLVHLGLHCGHHPISIQAIGTLRGW